MRAITIRQPYASLIVKGLKRYETRSFATNYRGALAIHAGKTPVAETLRDMPDETVRRLRYELGSLEDLPTGAVIGAVFIEDCIQIDDDLREKAGREETDVGFWEDGYYAWQIADCPLELSEPITCSGKQGFWEFSAVEALDKRHQRKR